VNQVGSTLFSNPLEFDDNTETTALSNKVLRKHVIAKSEKPLSFDEIKLKLEQKKEKERPTFTPNTQSVEKLAQCYTQTRRKISREMFVSIPQSKSKSGLVTYPTRTTDLNSDRKPKLLQKERLSNNLVKPIHGLNGGLLLEFDEINKRA
jgi:hypothetical protein